MLHSSDRRNSFGALLQKDHQSPLVTEIPYGSSLCLLMVFHLQYSSKVSEENMGAGTILGMCGCSNSCSIDRANKRRDVVSSFCYDVYCGNLNFAIRRERIYQGSNPCSIGVIFEILFR